MDDLRVRRATREDVRAALDADADAAHQALSAAGAKPDGPTFTVPGGVLGIIQNPHFQALPTPVDE